MDFISGYFNSLRKITKNSKSKSTSKNKNRFNKENFFFRFLTNTYCDTSENDQKDFNEKISMYYKNADYKQKESEKDMYITLDQIHENESQRFNHSISIISQSDSEDIKYNLKIIIEKKISLISTFQMKILLFMKKLFSNQPTNLNYINRIKINSLIRKL